MSAQYQLEQTKQTLTTSIERPGPMHVQPPNNPWRKKPADCGGTRLPEYGKRYEAGASTAIDYADARTLFDNARVNALRAKYDLAFKSRILDFYMGKAMTSEPLAMKFTKKF